MAKARQAYRKYKVVAEKMEKREKMELKFPNCVGVYPECPQEIDMKNLDEECKKCIKYYQRKK